MNKTNSTSHPLIYVMLDRVRSAYNVGSIFRSCDSAGVDKLFLTGYTATPQHIKVAKTALGSAESVTWEHHCRPIDCIQYLKKLGIFIMALEPTTDAQNLYQTNIKQFWQTHKVMPPAICLIFGNEVDGISPDILQLADVTLAIPHHGHKESLNVAVAAGVAIYEIYRQLKVEGKGS